MNISGGHLLEALRDQKIIVKNVVELLINSGWNFHAIAFTGASGALIAPVVAHEMDKKLILVRKEISGHSSAKVIGPRHNRNLNYIILDDLVASGTTIRNIYKEVSEFDSYLKCVGVILYSEYKKKNWISLKDGYQVPHLSFNVDKYYQSYDKAITCATMTFERPFDYFEASW